MPIRSVELIAYDRMPDMGEMHAQLMLPARHGIELDEAKPVAAAEYFILCDRGEAPFVRGAHLHQEMEALQWPRHRGLDAPGILLNLAADDGLVGLVDAPLLESAF